MFGLKASSRLSGFKGCGGPKGQSTSSLPCHELCLQGTDGMVIERRDEVKLSLKIEK